MISFLRHTPTSAATTVGPWCVLAEDNALGWSMTLISRCISQKVWSPVLYKEPHRRESNFLAMQVLALDYDDGRPTIDEAQQHFKDYAYILGTTKSHLIEKRGKVCERFRLVLFLETPIVDLITAKRFLTWATNEFKSDPACKDAARFFWPCKEIVAMNTTGRCIDWRQVSLIEPPAKVIEKPKSGKYFFCDLPAPEGKRNHTTFAAACHMLRTGLDHAIIRSRLSVIANGLPEKEIDTIFKHAMDAVKKNPTR